MATQLNKKLLRESTEKYDGREIMVTLSEDQTIRLKLKGLKTGEVKTGILELYQKLAGVEPVESKKTGGPIITKKSEQTSGKGKMVNLNEFLNDLRSRNAISTLDVVTMSKFDAILSEVVDEYKKIK
jgi:hypothetical protein